MEGGILLNMRKLFMMQAVERGEQNFVTKLNHVPHVACCLYWMSMPNELPPARSQGALYVKVWREVYYQILESCSRTRPHKGVNKILIVHFPSDFDL